MQTGLRVFLFGVAVACATRHQMSRKWSLAERCEAECRVCQRGAWQTENLFVDDAVMARGTC